MFSIIVFKLQASLGGSYTHFEGVNSLDKASFILGNESPLANIIGIREERKSSDILMD